VRGERRVSLPVVVDVDDVGKRECEVVGEGNEAAIVSRVCCGDGSGIKVLILVC
jgi:hypothetical protein